MRVNQKKSIVNIERVSVCERAFESATYTYVRATFNLPRLYRSATHSYTHTQTHEKYMRAVYFFLRHPFKFALDIILSLSLKQNALAP